MNPPSPATADPSPPAMPQNSETTVNAALADALRGKHPLWRESLGVEQSDVFAEKRALRPDIVVRPQHLQPVVLETEFAPASNVEREAAARLGLTPTGARPLEQVIAVRLPAALRHGQADLATRVATEQYDYCLLSGDASAPSRWPSAGWRHGGLDDIVRTMEQAMVSVRLLEEGMNVLEEAVESATLVVERSGVILPERLGERLNQRPGPQTTRMAMTIIANALIFQDSIAKSHQLPSMADLSEMRDYQLHTAILDTWRHIVTEINYWPVFRLASKLLSPFPGVEARVLIQFLMHGVKQLIGLGLTSHQDLAGRMFQRLIADRKFLATFYTRPESATLLAELAVARLPVDWGDLRTYQELRVADLSCGTGALLVAAYRAVLARHRLAGGDDRQLHRVMMERAIIAADIMPAAVHLCASQVSGVHAGETFDHTRIYTMPYGIGAGTERDRGVAIGSLDLIEAAQTRSLFPTGQRWATGRGDVAVEDVELQHRSVDLVIMNPPFTRPTNHEIAEVPVPSFAGFSTTEEEQRAMSERLGKIRRGLVTPVGHGNAGLASNFVDLAHVKVKPGGTVALVLPIAFLQGASWREARNLFATAYIDVVVVTVAEAGSKSRAFSADTAIAEALVIATKARKKDTPSGNALFVNLTRRPRGMVEASDLAVLVPSLPSTGAGPLLIGEQRVGTYIHARLEDGGCAALRETALASAMLALTEGLLRMPRLPQGMKLPITPLRTLGHRGPLHRDIGNKQDGQPPFRGPFKIIPASGVPSYPVLWAHDAERERRIVVVPDCEGLVRPGCDDHALRVWRTASTLHFTLDFTMTSQPLMASVTPEPCLGGRAWPSFQPEREAWVAPLALWANSTLGLMAFWWMGSRQQQGRAITTLSALPALPMLDVRALSDDQLDRAAAIFQRVSTEPLLPANEAYRDDARKALDRALLVDLLELPEDLLAPLDNLRLQWCAEPSVHGGKETGPNL